MIFRIKEILTQQGHSQRWLAQQLQMSEAEVSRMITRDALNNENQSRIAEALGVRRCELFSDFVISTTTIACPKCGECITIKTE